MVGGAYAYKTLVNDIKHDAQGARENTAKTTEVLTEMKATLSKMADTMDRIEFELKSRR